MSHNSLPLATCKELWLIIASHGHKHWPMKLAILQDTDVVTIHA